MATERTPLLAGETPKVMHTNFAQYRFHWKNIFRFCLCTALIIIIAAILLTTMLSAFSYENIQRNANDSSDALYNITWPLKDQFNLSESESSSFANDVEDIFNVGLKSLLDNAYEGSLPVMDIDSPSYRHQMTMKPTEKAKKMSKLGLIIEFGAKAMRKMRNCTRPSMKHLREKWTINSTKEFPEEVCTTLAREECHISRYRTLNGSCNNLKYPSTWGVSMHPFRRILLPDYSDSISAPRRSRNGDLPPAREVSLKIHRAFYVKDLDFTVMLAVWGQFIDHDMTATALSQGLNGEAITCCNQNRTHPECFVVRLEDDDPLYKDYNITCMDFVRSAPAPICRFGPREQLNQASSFIDGSAIYGNSKQLMDELRTFSNGELKMLISPTGEELLPVSTDVNDGCNRAEQFKRGRYCFLTGDLRSNENLHLTSMHLIFARQHNLLARNLTALNSHWKDEKVFQESRKILIAQLQHITYREFLPAILPEKLMSFLNLTLEPEGYFHRYNSSVNPTIANGFATAVFRFGHSLLPGLLKLISNDSSSEEYVELHKMLFNPFGLYDRDFLEQTIRGALNTSIEKSDVYFSKEVTENLFGRDDQKKGPCGLDLVSLNIQRGRDHGLPGYVSWRKTCGLMQVHSFDDLRGIFDAESLKNIRNVYKSIDEIDLFTGGLAEVPVKGGLLGPLFTCLMADQFLRLKIGDRHWYESPEKPQSFTPEQLMEVKKTSLARIICDNSQITNAQPMVMRRIGPNNVRKSCNELPSPKLDAWKE